MKTVFKGGIISKDKPGVNVPVGSQIQHKQAKARNSKTPSQMTILRN